jgi:peptide/nickel transport system permease protein
MTKLGLTLLLIVVSTAILADVVSPYDPWERFEPFETPSTRHWLGTNDIGNDVLSELIHGARISILVGSSTALIATLIGLLVEVTSGYFRGRTDESLMAATDVFLMVPRIPLVIIIAAFTRPSYGIIIWVLGLVWWTTTARVVRSKTLQVREMPFVTGDRAMGFSHLYILLTDIIPNIIHVVSPKFVLTVASAMISEASLSFLGLGDPSVKSWGAMIRYAIERGGLVNEMWWWCLSPGICITLCVLSIVLIGYTFEEGVTEMTVE